MNISSQYLLACKIPDKKSAVDLIEDPSCVMSHFLFYFQDSVFSLAFDHLTMMCLDVHSLNLSYLEFVELLG